jgi:hypothetical protein
VKQEFEVSVEELLRTLKRRGIPLPSEMGAFITLEVCEQIIDRPALLSTQDVAINEIGEVLCASALAKAEEAEAVRALLVLLGDLLVCSAPGVPSMLLELVERGPSEELFTLDRLRDDLEACLLPLNRGATRRVLARLLREARKAAPSAHPSQQPTAADIDADFDALLGNARPRSVPARREPATRGSVSGASAAVAPAATARQRRFEETPVTVPLPGGALDAVVRSPPGAAGANGASHALEDGASLADELEPADDGAGEPADFTKQVLLLRAADGGVDPVPPPSRDARRRAGSGRSNLDTDDLVEAGEPRSRAGLWIFAGFLVCALGLVGAYLGLGKEGVRSALGLLPQPRVSESAARSPFVGDNRARRSVGELRVTSNLGRAQVLLLIGPGPALATDLPVGVAQEFVALADGYAPARAIVPADAAWEEVDGKPRYELAIQASRSNNTAFKVGLGPTLLPRDVGTPQAKLGTVRVVTTPKGAKVYQLIGFTPDVRVENLPLDQDYDVLVYLEGRAPVSRHVEAADFEGSDGNRVCELDVTLSPAKAR